MAYDLKIVGGTVVDGTGSPARRGEVAIAGGRVVGLGDDCDGPAARTIDAGGCIVAPGFIDVHTHLDAQVLWDPMLSVSSWHGVTTVIAGNCGFGFAPTRPGDREIVMHMMENVEGMDVASLQAGLGDWGFETFPEFLDTIDRRGTALNFGALLPHCTIRLFVMGEEASTRPATAAEVDEMGALLRGALRAGAVGFSTTRHPGHSGAAGVPVPSRLAEVAEIEQLCAVMAEEGHGVFMATLGPGFAIGQLRRIAELTGRPITYASLIVGMAGGQGHRRLLERTIEAQEAGFEIVPQFSCLPVTVDFSLREPFFLASSAPGIVAEPTLEAEFSAVLAEPTKAGRRARYAEPGFADRFRAGTDSDGWHRLIWAKITIRDVPGRPELTDVPLPDYCRQRAVHPADALLELALESDLEASFATTLLNSDEDQVAELIRHPGTQIGLSDAGAHVAQLCDAGFASHLLGHWVREKEVLTVEEAVRMLTGDAARLYRITDRGRLAPGAWADVTVFDPARVGTGGREVRHDCPAGAPRIVVPAVGIEHVIVNGTPIREGDRDVADLTALPGRTIRRPQRAS
jgi:N-acyl-D-aspartate/D-glutamate deacylase